MAIQQTVTCDGCGQVKGQTNHWHRIRTSQQGLDIRPWVGGNTYGLTPEQSEALAFSNFEDRMNAFKATVEEKHACSDACVILFVQAWLSEQKAEQDRKTTDEACARMASFNAQNMFGKSLDD